MVEGKSQLLKTSLLTSMCVSFSLSLSLTTPNKLEENQAKCEVSFSMRTYVLKSHAVIHRNVELGVRFSHQFLMPIKTAKLIVETRERTFMQCGHTGKRYKETQRTFKSLGGPEVRLEFRGPSISTSRCGPTHHCLTSC